MLENLDVEGKIDLQSGLNFRALKFEFKAVRGKITNGFRTNGQNYINFSSGRIGKIASKQDYQLDRFQNAIKLHFFFHNILCVFISICFQLRFSSSCCVCFFMFFFTFLYILHKYILFVVCCFLFFLFYLFFIYISFAFKYISLDFLTTFVLFNFLVLTALAHGVTSLPPPNKSDFS